MIWLEDGSKGRVQGCCVQAAFRWRFAGSYTSAGMDQLERLSWTGTSYIVRDRYSTERVFLCL